MQYFIAVLGDCQLHLQKFFGSYVSVAIDVCYMHSCDLAMYSVELNGYISMLTWNSIG